MNVLSLFDGISCAKLALEDCGFDLDCYFASEIEPNAIKVATSNNPTIIEIGDVSKCRIRMVFYIHQIKLIMLDTSICFVAEVLVQIFLQLAMPTE